MPPRSSKHPHRHFKARYFACGEYRGRILITSCPFESLGTFLVGDGTNRPGSAWVFVRRPKSGVLSFGIETLVPRDVGRAAMIAMPMNGAGTFLNGSGTTATAHRLSARIRRMSRATMAAGSQTEFRPRRTYTANNRLPNPKRHHGYDFHDIASWTLARTSGYNRLSSGDKAEAFLG